jgi:hypothetical protein
MFRPKRTSVSVSIVRTALESIFDDCDNFDIDETGGRLLGTYRHDDGRFEIEVTDVIDAGPQAQRSPTFFLQDGEYQEGRFREIETKQPNIEHLGNWHTHHVNGYRTLSGGDRDTYFRTVNHDKHNTDFFYALLVVSRNRGDNPRYAVKHFLFRRGDSNVHEIPARNVHIVDVPVPPSAFHPVLTASAHAGAVAPTLAGNMDRAKDQDFFTQFYPQLKSLMSKDTGAVYWKGPVTLIDGFEANVVAMEDTKGAETSYSIATSCENPAVAEIVTQYRRRQFRSAREAVVNLERDLNRALYRETRRAAI